MMENMFIEGIALFTCQVSYLGYRLYTWLEIISLYKRIEIFFGLFICCGNCSDGRCIECEFFYAVQLEDLVTDAGFEGADRAGADVGAAACDIKVFRDVAGVDQCSAVGMDAVTPFCAVCDHTILEDYVALCCPDLAAECCGDQVAECFSFGCFEFLFCVEELNAVFHRKIVVGTVLKAFHVLDDHIALEFVARAAARNGAECGIASAADIFDALCGP